MKFETNVNICATLLAALLTCAANAAAQKPIKQLYAFTGPDGMQPISLALSGKTLYGTTVRGGTADGGTAFELAPPASPGGAWTETTLYSFPEISVGSSNPYVSFSKGGIVYGVTQNGGAAEHGTVFQLVPPASPGGAWTETDIYTFSGGSDGSGPEALIEKNGVLYGVTYGGGSTGCGYGCGVFFSLTAPATPGGAWTENVLYTFQGSPDAAAPVSLAMSDGGIVYGASDNGGAPNQGTVFALLPPSGSGSWTDHVLHNFLGFADAGHPLGVVIGEGGVLYGASSEGGTQGGECFSSGCGTVFSVAPPSSPGNPWTESILYSFAGGADGMYPVANVSIGSGGVLYGTTGSTYPNNTIFSLTPPAGDSTAWTKTILHGFYKGGGGGSSASYPSTGVQIGSSGILYGASLYGGADGDGTVYSLRP